MAERMAVLLRYANYQKVGDALGVGRAAVQKWAKGKNVGAHQLEQVERLFAKPWETHEEAAPPWAERLLAGVMALEMKGDVTDAELVAAEARAAIYLAANTQKQPRQGRGGAGGASNA